jgi:hypothetical protein
MGGQNMLNTGTVVEIVRELAAKVIYHQPTAVYVSPGIYEQLYPFAPRRLGEITIQGVPIRTHPAIKNGRIHMIIR